MFDLNLNRSLGLDGQCARVARWAVPRPVVNDWLAVNAHSHAIIALRGDFPGSRSQGQARSGHHAKMVLSEFGRRDLVSDPQFTWAPHPVFEREFVHQSRDSRGARGQFAVSFQVLSGVNVCGPLGNVSTTSPKICMGKRNKS